jgi:hypothetical protein
LTSRALTAIFFRKEVVMGRIRSRSEIQAVPRSINLAHDAFIKALGSAFIPGLAEDNKIITCSTNGVVAKVFHMLAFLDEVSVSEMIVYAVAKTINLDHEIFKKPNVSSQLRKTEDPIEP